MRVYHKDGAVLINKKKVRVPYSIQQTAIPAQSDGLIEYLFLDDYQICLITRFSLFLMGVLLVFIYYVNTTKSRLARYRVTALKTLLLAFSAFVISEFISFHVTQGWIIDTAHGINGSPGLFGINATFPNADYGSRLDLDYQPEVQLFITPLIALWVLSVNAKRRTEPAADL